jgi:RluA family pseudouridine synthase
MSEPDDLAFPWNAPTARLDRAIRTSFPEWARADIDAAIAGRRVRVNSRIVWMSSWKVERGDRIIVHDPPRAKASGASAFDPSWVIADEGSYLVVNKPEGLRSEPTRTDDVTPNLLTHLKSAIDSTLVLAHRLDRDTSGLIVATRPGPIRAQFDTMFSTHTIKKLYVAIIHAPNRFEASGSIDALIAPDAKRKDTMRIVERGGKRALTDYETLSGEHTTTRLHLWPRTGRTHQLRVHCAHLGGPILGDRIYGSDADINPRLMLHAESLTIPLAEIRTYVAPAPF